MESVKELHKKGKLDRKLRIRLIFLTSLTFIFGIIGAYNFIVHDFPLLWVVVTIVASFLLGMFVLSRMNKITWDEKHAIMTVGRIDGLGFVVLVLYVVVRVGTKWFLGHFSHNVVLISGLTVASVFGIMLGRLSATFISIHQLNTRK